MKSRFIIHEGVSLTCVGHPAAPYPSLGSGPSRLANLGDPLAQDFPVKIEDETILPKNFSWVDKPGGELVISRQALKFRYGQTDF